MDTTNPCQGISPPNAGESDKMVISFYDTEHPDNEQGDPVVERAYELDDDQLLDLQNRMSDVLGMDIEGGTVATMLIDNDELYEILDDVATRVE